jgi:hypothetical protein
MRVCDLPRRCFQGVVPAVIATCDLHGAPNVTYLSQVFYVDEHHVALSCQFFNKTKKNVLTNPHAKVEILDPLTLDCYRLDLRYQRAETSGPLFGRMSVRIDAIASHTGMTGIFKLLSADVYEVVAIERVDGFLDEAGPETAPDDPSLAFRTEIAGLQLVSQRLSRAIDLDTLLLATLETLQEAFGYTHSMVFLLDESGTRLFAVASRGYGDGWIGAELGVGEGLIGTVARERCVLRVAGVGSDLRYGRAIRASVHRAGGRGLRPEIPLPGLVDSQSQMVLPLVAGDRLVGVIAVESRAPAAFDEWHEAYFEIIANQVAAAIENMVRRGREAEASEPTPAAQRSARMPPAGSAEPRRCAAPAKRIRFFAGDECVFVGDEYLVRGMPAKILWRLLRDHVTDQRVAFTNRELRCDASLGLPAFRDNLESRLVLLRKRLEQKCPEIALVSTGRGTFRLETSASFELEEEP